MIHRMMMSTSLLLLIGCSSNGLDKFQSPEQLTLYSIDGRDREIRKKTEETFRGYPVLGKVQVNDDEAKRKLVSAFKDGIARAGPPAECFWPRHGLRIVEKGVTVEYIICFECSQFHEYVGERHSHSTINPDVKPAFDAPLKAAGIAIAPGK